MNKFWQVFKHEYLRHVLRKRFILALLSVPIFALVMVGVTGIMIMVMMDNDPIGYVDPSGYLNNVSFEPEGGNLFPDPAILPYTSEESALEALRSKELQAVFILDEHYAETGAARLITPGEPSDNVILDFKWFVKGQIAKQLPKKTALRVVEGAVLTIRAEESERQMQESLTQILGLMLPFASGIIFMIAVSTSGNYLLQALVEEKENRTMEIVVTSLSPNQLMMGKILGNMCVGLTQLVVWFGLGGGILLVGMIFLPIAAGLDFQIGQIVLSIVLWLLAFVLISTLMAIAGVAATEEKEAQQISGIFSLLFAVPFWFMTILFNKPHSALSIGLSIFPLTAPLSLPVRLAVSDVPGWQIAITIVVLAASIVLGFWLAGRAFRMGMLRYGKKLTWREIFGHTPKQTTAKGGKQA